MTSSCELSPVGCTHCNVDCIRFMHCATTNDEYCFMTDVRNLIGTCADASDFCLTKCLKFSHCFLCTNTCDFGGDSECDDGGQGSEYTSCPSGSDCEDCGIRGGHVHEPPPSLPSPHLPPQIFYPISLNPCPPLSRSPLPVLSQSPDPPPHVLSQSPDLPPFLSHSPPPLLTHSHPPGAPPPPYVPVFSNHSNPLGPILISLILLFLLFLLFKLRNEIRTRLQNFKARTRASAIAHPFHAPNAPMLLQEVSSMPTTQTSHVVQGLTATSLNH